jgi:hypothetical protein
MRRFFSRTLKHLGLAFFPMLHLTGPPLDKGAIDKPAPASWARKALTCFGELRVVYHMAARALPRVVRESWLLSHVLSFGRRPAAPRAYVLTLRVITLRVTDHSPKASAEREVLSFGALLIPPIPRMRSYVHVG